jgi:hypothetical protein
MDDLNIHIDELVLDGSASVDEAALAAGVGDRLPHDLGEPWLNAEIARAVSRSIAAVPDEEDR